MNDITPTFLKRFLETTLFRYYFYISHSETTLGLKTILLTHKNKKEALKFSLSFILDKQQHAKFRKYIEQLREKQILVKSEV